MRRCPGAGFGLGKSFFSKGFLDEDLFFLVFDMLLFLVQKKDTNNLFILFCFY